MASRVDGRRSGTERRSGTPIGTGRRAGAVLAAVVFAAVLLGTLAVVQRLPTTYAAASVVSFLPRPETPVGADTVQLVGEKYAVLATSPDVLRSAGTATGDQRDDLRTATTAVLGQGTGNLQVTVTLPDRDRAAQVANAVAGVLVRASARDELVTGELISAATGPDAEVRPARMLLRGVGVLAAVLAAALVWAMIAGSRRRERAEATAESW